MVNISDIFQSASLKLIHHLNLVGGIHVQP